VRGNGLGMCQERFRLDIRKSFFTKSLSSFGIGCPKEAVESPSLEVYKRLLDVALRDMV